MGFYKTQKGGVYVDDQFIHDYNMDSYLSSISYVSQNTKLFNKSVYENITYGNNATKDDVQQLIQKFNISSIFKNLKKGLDTNVGVNGDKLSGGQRQCIHILKTFLSKNKIIILDEPTSAIDIHHKKIIM
jgi:ATP-binding cassette subfamily B protein